MNMVERTERMKKFILMNNIVIIIQIVLVVLSVIFNFLIDDFAVFITVFIHIAIFVLYNGIVESIVEYGYLRKKFAKICDETHYLRYFKLKNCIKHLIWCFIQSFFQKSDKRSGT